MYSRLLSSFTVYSRITAHFRPCFVRGALKMSDLAAGKKAAAIKAVNDYVKVIPGTS